MKKQPVPNPDQYPAGFTLLETVIALGLLSVVLLFTSTLLVTVIKTNALAQNQTGALALAQGRMETLKSLPVAGLKAETESQVTTGNLPLIYRRETAIDRGEAPGCALVTVKVTWPAETGSGVHRVELATLIAE